MQLNLAVPSPLQYFSCLVQSDAHFPLLEAAICLAQDEYPDLDVEQIIGDVVLRWCPKQRELAHPLLDTWMEIRRRLTGIQRQDLHAYLLR